MKPLTNPRNPVNRVLRGVTLVEIMAVVAVAGTVAAFGTGALVEQVRRNKAINASNNALFPHTIARDRAVAARNCVETILVPPIGSAFAPPGTIPAPAVPAQARFPQVAVIQYDGCGDPVNVVRIDLYPLEGEVTFTAYDSPDARLVYGPDGGLTSDRPGVAAGVAVCGAGAGGDGITGGGGRPGDGTGTCLPPPSAPPPPDDVNFAAHPYFAANGDYRVYARVGGTEHR